MAYKDWLKMEGWYASRGLKKREGDQEEHTSSSARSRSRQSMPARSCVFKVVDSFIKTARLSKTKRSRSRKVGR